MDRATRPSPFRDYGDADRLPLDTSVAGPLLQAGAGIVRSQPRRDYGGGTMHWRAYSSAGGLFPVEAYVAARDGVYSFDVLGRALVRIADGDARAGVADATAVGSGVDAFVVLTGITARTAWKYGERGYRHVWWDAGTMLANLLALAAAEALAPRLYVAFVDDALNDVLGVDGAHEFALAVLALGSAPPGARASAPPRRNASEARYPLAERAHAAGKLGDGEAVRSRRTSAIGAEPRLDRDALARAIAERSSVRAYAPDPLPRAGLAELLAWSEAPIPADAPRIVRQVVTVASVDGLAPGIYDADLSRLRELPEAEIRERAGYVAMEQDHPRDAAVNVFQLADVGALDERDYRWAQLEAGIRAGRLQVGAFARGWRAAASTFYDEEVSRFLDTDDAPMLMVAVGPAARAAGPTRG